MLTSAQLEYLQRQSEEQLERAEARVKARFAVVIENARAAGSVTNAQADAFLELLDELDELSAEEFRRRAEAVITA